MPADTYTETAFVEPLMPEVEAERGDWAERIITIVAATTGVLVVAAVAVVIGVG